MNERMPRPFRKLGYSLIVALSLILMPADWAGQSNQHHGPDEPIPPKRFVKDNLGQHPYSIVLSCSDSRVPPEIVFDETLGKVFVSRVAGNVADPTELGSIEYASDHRYSRLLFVMAHDQCGAVKTTMDVVRTGKYPSSPNLMALVSAIKTALDRNRLDTNKKADVAVNVDRNLRAQMENVVKKSGSLAKKVRSGELLIVGAIYDLEKGDANPVYYVDRSGKARRYPPAKPARSK